MTSVNRNSTMSFWVSTTITILTMAMGCQSDVEIGTKPNFFIDGNEPEAEVQEYCDATQLVSPFPEDSYIYWPVREICSDGTTISAGEFTALEGNMDSTYTYFIARHNGDGSIMWLNEEWCPEDMKCEAESILPLPDCSAIVQYGNPFGNGENLFVMKIDADGAVLWTQELNTWNFDELVSPYDPGYPFAVMDATSDGQTVFVSNVFSGELTLDSGGSNETVLVDHNDNGWDMYLAAYSASGELLWARNAQEPFYPNSIAVDGDENLIIAGHNEDAYAGGSKEQSLELGVYNLSGDKLVRKVIGSADPADELQDMMMEISDSQVTSYFRPWIQPSLLPFDDGTFVVFGGVLQAVTLFDDSGQSITFGNAPDVYVWTSSDGNQTFGRSTGSTFAARYDIDGGLLWAFVTPTLDASNSSTISAKALDGDSGIIITGDVIGSVVFNSDQEGETLLTDPDNKNAYMARYNLDGTLDWVKYLPMESNNSWPPTFDHVSPMNLLVPSLGNTVAGFPCLGEMKLTLQDGTVRTFECDPYEVTGQILVKLCL